jgi:hypothetical protein
MPEFKENVPVVQADPLVSVDIKQDQPMSTGKHRFRLVVVDDAGNESDPAFLDVVVRDTEKPTAVLEVVNSDGAIVEPAVPFGKPFILSAAQSSDVAPGKIQEYRFTLLSGF